MCGLVGIYGSNLSDNLLNTFKLMLNFDVVRGAHSTGAGILSSTGYGVNREFDLHVYKVEGPPANLHIRYPEVFDAQVKYQKRSVQQDIHMLMGHNRHATIGAKTSVNAHPFVVGNLVGSHNGTISKGLETLSNKGVKGDTDSERIFASIAEGKELGEVLKGLAGAAALVWYNFDEETFNLFRNDKRPLHYAISKDGRTLVYSSEEWIMLRAMENSSTLSLFDKEKVQSLGENEHLVFSKSSTGTIEVKKGGEVKLEAPTYASTYGAYSGGHNYNYNHRNYGHNSGVHNRKAEKKDLPMGTGWFKFDPPLNSITFAGACKNGCSICDADLEFKDVEEIKFLDRDTPLCADCAKTFS